MPDEIPRLSPSTAHILTSESPLHAWTFHRLLGGLSRPDTDATRKGRLFHDLLLTGGQDIEVYDFDDWRKKEARESRDDALVRGKTPLLRHQHVEMQDAVAIVRQRLAEDGIDLARGRSEVRLEWEEPSTYDSVQCTGRVDWINESFLTIRELKTGDRSISPDQCAARLVREGGAIQAAAYASAIGRLWPELMGAVEVEFIFIETAPPYAVMPAVCGGSMQEYGERRWLRAVETWAECRARNRWPGPGRERLEAPAWAIARELLEEA